jgi:TRAP-type mannitol/chloroaromatic compound transport system substrate-binding protein
MITLCDDIPSSSSAAATAAPATATEDLKKAKMRWIMSFQTSCELLLGKDIKIAAGYLEKSTKESIYIAFKR